MLLAHGVGRIYDLPVPLEYYLTGSAVAVIGSFVVTALLSRRAEDREPRRLLGPRFVAGLTRTVRIGTWAGFALAFVTGAVESATGFSFNSIWLWVGLVVGLTVLNVVFGGLWLIADPWLPLAGAIPPSGASPGSRIARYAGPVLIFALFWFELASGGGFTQGIITPVLLLYCVYAIWLRARFDDWEGMDPFVILYRFASRASLTSVEDEGIFVRSPGAGPADRTAMAVPLFVVLFLLLGATSLDNLREIHGWETVKAVIGSGIPEMLYDTIALALLGLPFFLTFRLAMAPARRELVPPAAETDRTFAWSLAPIAIAYLLAHNVSLFLVTLPVWFETLSDPLGLGWNIFGLGNVLAGYQPSPALVWFLEVGLVVGGHIVAVVMGHRIAQGLSKTRRAPLASQVPMTLLMSLYTVGTLWLLSLAVVSS